MASSMLVTDANFILGQISLVMVSMAPIFRQFQMEKLLSLKIPTAMPLWHQANQFQIQPVYQQWNNYQHHFSR